LEEASLAKQVADEIKGLITASVNSIRDQNYQNAHHYLNQALYLTELIEYHAGTTMVLYNLANLHAVTGDNINALQTAALALEKARISHVDEADCQKLVRTLFLTVQKEGVDFVKNKDYPRALSCFEAGLPYAQEEKKASLEKQIALIRRIIDERQ
jgi:hypothetical protein